MPEKAGIIVDVIKRFGGKPCRVAGRLPRTPGDRSYAKAWAGKVIRAPQIMHGKTSKIHHDNKTIFRKLRQ